MNKRGVFSVGIGYIQFGTVCFARILRIVKAADVKFGLKFTEC